MAYLLLAAISVVSWTTALIAADQPALESTFGLMAAVEEADGFSIIPATDVPGQIYTEDLAPPQVFEVIRPDGKPFSVGRLFSTCGCVLVTMAKKDFAQDERALLVVRNIKPTPAAGATYMIYVQIDQPMQEVLQYDVFVKSEKTAGAER